MSLIWSPLEVRRWPIWAQIKSPRPLTCSLEVEPDLTETPHHVLELQQEREQTVVLVHAAVGDDDVQRPVHLGNVAGGSAKRCERKQSRRGKNRCEGERREVQVKRC